MTRKLITTLILGAAVTQFLFSQTVNIKGTVSEKSTGDPVPGASVYVKGTSNGVVADGNGAYSIVADATATLVFSSLGYKEAEVQPEGRSIVDVSLEIDSQMLEEVIAIGYGTVKKSDLTGSVASVKGESVVNQAASSVEKLLQGRVAGLTVIDSSNDSPESNVTVRIRGISSINGSNSPLVVVDGVPMGDAGALSSVNPNIIESIEVLKDASATAIYGSRGANGVIMITTKSGIEAHTDVWFSAKVGVGMFSRKLETWGRDELVRMAENMNMTYENGGSEGPYVGKVFSDGIYYPSVEEIESGAWSYYTDWTKEVFRRAVTQEYNVGVEGSSNGSRYYASLGYYDGQGMQYNDDYDKISADLSYENRISRKLTFSSKAGFVRGKRNHNMGTSYARNPLWPVYNGDGTYFKANSIDYGNPVMINNEVTNNSESLNGYLNARVDWKIIDGLTFTATGSGRAQQSRNCWYNPPKYTYGGDTYNGEGGVGESTWLHLQTDALLRYEKAWGRHNFSAMAGASYENRVDQYSSITGRGFTNSALKYETVSGAEKVTTATGRSQWMLASAFTRLTYDWSGRYFATFTARADGSSKFAEGHRWGFFPSGALGWRIDREPFMEGVDAVSLLKLRASYGVSGNQGISPYQTFEMYGWDYFWSGDKEYTVYGVGYQSGREGIGDRYVTYAGMANHDLSWEKTSQFDIGVDLGLFDDRLTLTLDYYRKYTSDLLRQQYLAPSSGFDTVWVNDGEILNQGFEFNLSGRIVDTRDWTLSATGIFSLNRNKVLRLGTNENSGFTTDPNGISFTAYGGSVYDSPFLNVLAIGYPVNVFYGYQANGITQSEIGDGTSRYTEPGEINYVGLREDGTFDASQRRIIGDPNPKFTASLSVNLSHRCGVDFSMLLYSVYGNDIFSYRKLDSMSYRGNFWTYENPSRYYPKLRYNRSYVASSWSVEDGSFLRISNITLGYTLPQGYVSWLKKLRLYLSVNNPYTFMNTSSYDPEVGENGNGYPAYPKVCTITTGLELKF